MTDFTKTELRKRLTTLKKMFREEHRQEKNWKIEIGLRTQPFFAQTLAEAIDGNPDEINDDLDDFCTINQFIKHGWGLHGEGYVAHFYCTGHDQLEHVGRVWLGTATADPVVLD